jgi:hypothetical protein
VGERLFASTRDAVGGRVILLTSRGRQIREVQGGMGFASHSEHTVHFGVPDRDSVEQIEIRWPSGRVQLIEGGQAKALLNRQTRIVEGEEDPAT